MTPRPAAEVSQRWRRAGRLTNLLKVPLNAVKHLLLLGTDELHYSGAELIGGGP
jgi:hypothetical protein